MEENEIANSGDQRNIFNIPLLAKRWDLKPREVITKLCEEYRRSIFVWIKGETVVTGWYNKPNIPIHIVGNDLNAIKTININLKPTSQKFCDNYERIQCKILLRCLIKEPNNSEAISIKELYEREMGSIKEYESLINPIYIDYEKIFCFVDNIIGFERRAGIKEKPVSPIKLEDLHYEENENKITRKSDRWRNFYKSIKERDNDFMDRALKYRNGGENSIINLQKRIHGEEKGRTDIGLGSLGKIITKENLTYRLIHLKR